MNLERFININASLHYEYSNSLHTHFHTEMLKLINNGTITAEALNVTKEAFAEWKRIIELMVQIEQQLRANLETQQLNEIDTLRDSYITYTFQTVRNELLSPIPAKKEAAETLMLIVDKYSGLQTDAVDVESTRIVGLLESLRSQAAHCSALGLDEIINLLETTNNEYIALKEQRTTVRTDATLPSSKKVRAQADEMYAYMCEHIQATHLVGKDAKVKADIEAMVDKMNQFIDETKTTYNQMQAQAKAKDKKEKKNKKQDEQTEQE